MWETQHNIAGLDYFKTLILSEISKTQNQHQEEFCAFSGVTRLCQKVGCARNKLQFHTVLQKLKSFLLMPCLRMDGIPALNLWDLVIEIFHSVPNKIEQPKEELQGNPLQATKPNVHNPIQFKHTNVIPTNIDHIPSNTTHSGVSAMLYVFEDNEAVIKMIIKSRSPTMRHVSRTHRVALDCCLTGLLCTPKNPNPLH